MSCVLFAVYLYVGEGNYQQKAKEFVFQIAINMEIAEISHKRSYLVDKNLPTVKIRSPLPK